VPLLSVSGSKAALSGPGVALLMLGIFIGVVFLFAFGTQAASKSLRAGQGKPSPIGWTFVRRATPWAVALAVVLVVVGLVVGRK
jgi:predicted anti-sigma-YlaC factor YlaD